MPSSPVVAGGLSLIAAALAAMFLWAVDRSAPRGSAAARRRRLLFAGVGAFGWMGLLALAALSGVLARFDLRPPPLMVAAFASVALGVGLGVSRLGAELAGLPLWVLVGWQSFRLPLELLMHEAALEGLMPNVMSFSGKNFDILSGLSALILAICLRRFQVSRFVVVVWNVIASALLLVIIVIAVAATPLMRAFGDNELNTWIAYFPYIWLPGVMVLSAVMGHVVITRRLLAETRRSPLERGAATPH